MSLSLSENTCYMSQILIDNSEVATGIFDFNLSIETNWSLPRDLPSISFYHLQCIDGFLATSLLLKIFVDLCIFSSGIFCHVSQASNDAHTMKCTTSVKFTHTVLNVVRDELSELGGNWHLLKDEATLKIPFFSITSSYNSFSLFISRTSTYNSFSWQ